MFYAWNPVCVSLGFHWIFWWKFWPLLVLSFELFWCPINGHSCKYSPIPIAHAEPYLSYPFSLTTTFPSPIQTHRFSTLHAHHPSYPTHHHPFLSLYPTTHLTNHILYLPIPINVSTIHFHSHTSSKPTIIPLTISIFSPPYLHILIPISYTIHRHPPYLPRIPIFQIPMRPISLTHTHFQLIPTIFHVHEVPCMATHHTQLPYCSFLIHAKEPCMHGRRHFLHTHRTPHTHFSL